MSVLGVSPLSFERIELPSKNTENPENDWVELWQELTVDQLFKFQEATKVNPRAGYAQLIKDWSFTLADGTKAPISTENFGKLNSDHLWVIIDNCKALESTIAFTKKKGLI